ncbi:MAG: outer membrane lipoprotein carrier protein LolA [Flavobacteriaceae bacterium]|nr:outer membrane lipoprotein carrier protein LolA [Flavobacteriaceae bacterium]MDG2315162.1 outer membrane lipoprotein carrier protein LolA [Flavobacteriaceae bacterium]
MKPFFLILLLISSHLGMSQNDPKAEALLEKVSNTINSYDTIGIDFTYILENRAEDVRQDIKGSLLLKGNSYRLDFMGITQICDAKKTYTIVPENEEITINPVSDDNTATITPNKLLSFYKEGYVLKWDILQTVMNKKIRFIKLIPIDSNSEISYLLLGIDRATHHIYKLIEIGKNKTQTVLTVNRFRTNPNIPSEQLAFNPNEYEGYYIDEF